jgi:branched-chain amino acid transport system permease protein
VSSFASLLLSVNGTEVEQVLVIGLIVGSFFGLLGAGFGLIMGVSGRFHFAYATTFVYSVYQATTFISWGAPRYVGILGGVICGAILGILIEAFLYSPLVKRTPHSALLAVFVTSLGIVIIGENGIRLIWGSYSTTLDPGFTVSRLDLGNGVGVTNLDLVMFGVCLLSVLVLWFYLRTSRYGRAIRAVQENPDMAAAVGVKPGLAYLVVFGIGSVMAGVGAMLFTMRGAMVPNSGIQPMFQALVVAFLAGLRSSPLRFLVVGMILGVLQAASDVWISPSWSTVVVFSVLFVYVGLTPYVQAHGNLFRVWSLRPLRRT